MERTNKNRRRSLTDFLRYRKGEMSGEEKNSFERDLQKDPFAEEASEGFSQITSEEAEMDMSVLKKKLAGRTGKRSMAYFYRLAAAVAVLVTLTFIFFNYQNKKGELILSKNNIAEVKSSLTITATEPLKDSSEQYDVKNEAHYRLQSSLPPPPASPSPVTAIAKSEAKVEEIRASADATGTDEIISDQIITIDSAAVKNDLIAVSGVAEDDAIPAETEKKMEVSRVAGVSLQTQTQEPLTAKSKSFFSHVPPQPVVGLDSFNLWLEKNIRNPEPRSRNEGVVVLSFKVMNDSTVADIKIITSPGYVYSREAERLIKVGPVWKPASENGKPIEEETSIKIIFR
jgi:hypothetical protein